MGCFCANWPCPHTKPTEGRPAKRERPRVILHLDLDDAEIFVRGLRAERDLSTGARLLRVREMLRALENSIVVARDFGREEET